MSRYAEKLRILTDRLEGLMARVYTLRKAKQPNFMKNNSLKKISHMFEQRFPDIPPDLDKMAGYKELKHHANDIQLELTDFYNTFIDVYDWKNAAFDLLEGMSRTISEFKFDENRELVTLYMDLVVGYIQLHVLVQTVPYLRLNLAYFARAIEISQRGEDQSFTKLGPYIADFADPIRRLQDEFSANVSQRVGATLRALWFPLMNSRDMSRLRDQRALNLYESEDKLTTTVNSEYHHELAHLERFHVYVLLGFLTCFQEIEVEGSMDLLRGPLSDGWAVPIYRDEVLRVHEQYAQLFSWYNPKMKEKELKKFIPACIAAALANSGAQHAERRNYLKLELSNMLKIFRDCPALIAPKFQVVLAALSMAKAEILWYLRHKAAPPPKHKKVGVAPGTLADDTLSKLIYLVVELTFLIEKNSTIVQRYYCALLNTHDRDDIARLVTAASKLSLDPKVEAILRGLPDVLAAATLDNVAPLEAMRMNWSRILVQQFSAGQASSRKAMHDLFVKMDFVVYHSRLVDALDLQLERFASLKLLWWYLPHVDEVYEVALGGRQNQPLHCLAFLRLFNVYTQNATYATPGQKVLIGKNSVKYAQQWLERLVKRVEYTVGALTREFMQLENENAPVQAANRIHHLQQQKQSRAYQQQGAPLRHLPLPGHESVAMERGRVETLRVLQKQLGQLCSVLAKAKGVVVYDHLFNPLQYLRDSMVYAMYAYIQSNLPGPNGVQRPSVLHHHMIMLLRVIKLVENFAPVDVRFVIRHVFLTQGYDPAISATDDVGRVGSDWMQRANRNLMVHAYSQWYVNFISSNVANGRFFYSEPRKGFVSSPHESFKAEEFTDMFELKHLVKMVGPWGVRLMDNDLLSLVQSHFSQIKNELFGQRDQVTEFAQNYLNERQMFVSLKNVRNLDVVLHALVVIGSALKFRALLREALGAVVKESVPFVYQCMDNALSQYSCSYYTNPEFTNAECVAADAGIALGHADYALRRTMAPFVSSDHDTEMYGLLPFLFAAVFYAPSWRAVAYDARLEAHTNNGHTIPAAVEMCLSVLLGWNLLDGSPTPRRSQGALEAYLRCSAFVLLRMGREPGVKTAYPIQTILLVLDAFVRESSAIRRSQLEAILPYSTIRAAYLEVYEHKRQHAHGEGDGLDASALEASTG